MREAWFGELRSHVGFGMEGIAHPPPAPLHSAGASHLMQRLCRSISQNWTLTLGANSQCAWPGGRTWAPPPPDHTGAAACPPG